MLSQNPAAVAARERRQQERDTEFEASREHILEMIERYGLDYSRWPKPKTIQVPEENT